MVQVIDWLKNGFLFAVFVLLAAVALLLFAVLAVAMRPILIALIVVAIASVWLLCLFSPSFRQWWQAVGEPQIQYNGLHLASDVEVHPNHSWARMGMSEVVVGADDLVQTTLGPVETVELPSVGSQFRQGEHLFSLRRGDRRVDVSAPVSGTVVSRNEALVEHPHAVNEQPFGSGWVVRLRADRLPADRPRLLHGKQARGWFRREVDRLLSIVMAEEAAAPALPDGGNLVGDFYRHIDDNAWGRLKETFFDNETKA